jgi:hypothetical protein
MARRGKPLARGRPCESGMLAVTRYFDPETFAAIRALAEKEKGTFHAQVHGLVKLGLDVIELSGE